MITPTAFETMDKGSNQSLHYQIEITKLNLDVEVEIADLSGNIRKRTVQDVEDMINIMKRQGYEPSVLADITFAVAVALIRSPDSRKPTSKIPQELQGDTAADYDGNLKDWIAENEPSQQDQSVTIDSERGDMDHETDDKSDGEDERKGDGDGEGGENSE